MGKSVRSNNIFEQEFGEEKPNGKTIVATTKKTPEKKEPTQQSNNIFEQSFGLKKKEESPTPSQTPTPKPVQSSVGSGDGTMLAPPLPSLSNLGQKERNDVVSNGNAVDLLDEYKKTAKQKNDEVAANPFLNIRAYKDYSQSRQGKVGKILSDVIDKGEVNSEDIEYLSKVAPKATQDLFSVAGMEGTEVTKDNVNKFVDTLREKVDVLNTEQKIQNNKVVDANVKVKLSSIGIDPNKLSNDENYANTVSTGIDSEKNRELSELDRQYPLSPTYGKSDYMTSKRKNESEYNAKKAAIDKKYSEIANAVGISKAYDFAKRNPSFTPKDIGEIYLKYADPDTYKLWVKSGKKGAIDRDIADIGVRALYSTGLPGAVELAKRDEQTLDDLYPDKMKTEVLHRLGAELYKDENWFMNAAPDVEKLDKAAAQLPQKYRDFYYKHIREEERKNIGTNVPLSGFINKVGEGIGSTAEETWKGVGDLVGLRSEKDQAINALNEAQDTRFQGVGAYAPAKQRLTELNDKQKSGKELTPDEVTEKQDLETFTGVRSTGQEIIDGTGNLTGQVIFQALATKGLGGVATRGLKGAGLLKSAQVAEGLATEDMIASNAMNFGLSKEAATNLSAAAIAYASSYDAAKRDAIRLMPDDKDAGKRAVYSNIVAGLNAATERIFKDERVLNAFNKEISPNIKTLVGKLAKGDITKEALAPAITQTLLKSKEFLKEALISNTKEATEELATSAGQSIATSILAPAKFNEKEAYDDAISTFTTTFLHGGLVAGLGGIQSFRANNLGIPTIAKLGIDEKLTNDTKSYINAQLLSGDMTQDEANGKFKILNTASKINREVMPQVDAVSKLPQKTRDKYAVQLLNEAILKGQIEITQDEVLKGELEKKVKESEKVRKGILGKELFVDDDYVVKDINQINTEETLEDETKEPVQNTDALFDRVFEKKGEINNILDENKKDESVSMLKDQALTTPSNLNEKLGNDEELTTDIISQNTTEQIQSEITKLEDQLKKEGNTEQQIEEIDKHLSLLDKGLKKAESNQTVQDKKDVKEKKVAEKVKPITQRMNDAEYINEKELDAAADELYTALDDVEKSDDYTTEQKDNARNLIEPLIDKIESYEFRTKTETRKVAETKATQVSKPANERKRETKPALEKATGTTVTVKTPDGSTATGKLNIKSGQYVVDVPGGTQRVIGEKAITDRDLSLPTIEEQPMMGDTDEKGDFSFTVKDKNGNLITIKDPEVALDLAIQARADAIGEVSMEEFDTVYETIEKEVQEEVLANEGKKVESKKEQPKESVTEKEPKVEEIEEKKPEPKKEPEKKEEKKPEPKSTIPTTKKERVKTLSDRLKEKLSNKDDKRFDSTKTGVGGKVIKAKGAKGIMKYLSSKYGIESTLVNMGIFEPYGEFNRRNVSIKINSETTLDEQGKYSANTTDNISRRTIFHEYIHPFVEILSKNNKELYDEIYLKAENENSNNKFADVDHYDPDHRKEELVVRYLDRLSDLDNPPNIFQRFVDWVSSFFYNKRKNDSATLKNLSKDTTVEQLYDVFKEYGNMKEEIMESIREDDMLRELRHANRMLQIPDLNEDYKKELEDRVKDIEKKLNKYDLISNGYEKVNKTAEELGITKDDSIETVIDKTIAGGGVLSEALKVIRQNPNLSKVKFSIEPLNGMEGIYTPLETRNVPEDQKGTLKISDKVKDFEYALTHELGHFLTIDGGNIRTLADKAKLNQLENIYNFVKEKEGSTKEGKATNITYGLTSFEEFVAELLINPDLRKRLEGIKAENSAEFDKVAGVNVDSIGKLVADFFRDIWEKIFGASGVDKDQVDRAVEIMTELFFGGQDVTAGQQAGNIQEQSVNVFKDGKLALPTGEDLKSVNEFIESSREEGYSDEDIKEALLDNGFSESDANQLLGIKEPSKKSFENNNKAILNRISESKNIPQYVKDRFATKLKYKPQSHVAAREMAVNIIKEFGVENSIEMAESGRFDGDINSMIFAEGIDQTFEKEQKATTVEGKQRIAEQWADYATRYDQMARDKGRFISAVYEFYRRSPLGMIMQERQSREEKFDKWFQGKEKGFKELFDELKNEPEFQEYVNEQVKSQTKADRQVNREKRRDKIVNIFDSAKIKNDGSLKMSLVPPQIWNAAMEVMKQAALAGESLVDVIEAGISHIKQNHNQAFDEQKLRKEWETQFSGIDKQTVADRALTSAKTRLRKQVEHLNKQIAAGARMDVEKNKIEYDDEAKALVAERDALRAQLDEMLPLERKPLTEDQKVRMAENALKRSIAEYERRISEGDTSSQKKEKVSSPELDRLRKVRDDLKGEYDALKKEANKPSDEEIAKKKQTQIIERFRKRLSGLTDEQKEDVIRRSFGKLVENGALEYPEFKKIIADVMGIKELTDTEVGKINEYVNDLNAVQDAADVVLEKRDKASIEDFQKKAKKAERAATELHNIRSSKTDIGRRISSIIQLNTLGLVSLIKNPIYNVAYQILVRFPRGVVQTALDQTIYGVSVLANKAFNTPVIKPDVNILLAQKGYFSKGKEGGSESIEQVFTGLTNLDYFQKEIRSSQIKPAAAWRDLWEWKKGEKFLEGKEVADRLIQGTVGIPAEVVARLLNIGDKGFRFGAQGAVASTIAQQEFGIKEGIDREIFMAFPKEEATRLYKKQGMEHDEAVKRAEKIEERIIKEGEQSVFQQENLLNKAITGIGEGLRQFSEKHPDAKAVTTTMGILGTVNMPFVKTPANIAWDLFNLAIPEIAITQSALYGFAAAYHKYKGNNELAADYALKSKKWVSHGVVGYALLSMAGYYASIGAISGSDDEEKGKERKGKKTYQRPRSLNISKVMRAFSGNNSDEDGDLLVDLSWFGVPGTIMNMQANRYENMSQEERNNLNAVGDITGRMKQAATEGLENSIFSSSIAGLNAVKQGGRWVNSWFLNTINVGANFFHPASFAQWSRAELPYNPEIKGDNFADELKNNFASRSSLFRLISGYKPDPAITIWGDPAMRNNTGFKGTAFNMLGWDEVNKEIFAEPIFQDFKRTGNSSFFPPEVMPKMTVDGQDMKMGIKEERQYKTLIGQARKALVAPFINDMATLESRDEEINDKKYSEMTNEQKVKALNILYKKGFEAGKSEFKVLHQQYMSTKEKEKFEEGGDDN